MGKQKTKRALKDNEAKAVLRTLKTSGQKLNLVAAMIRGKKVDRALAELTFSRKRIAGPVKKTLESAIGKKVWQMSSVSGDGIRPVLFALLEKVDAARRERTRVTKAVNDGFHPFETVHGEDDGMVEEEAE